MTSNTNQITNLIVVSRDPAVLRPVWSLCEPNRWKFEIAADPWEAIDRVQSGAPLDLLLLDLPLTKGESLHSLRWLRKLRPALPIILIGHPDDNGRKLEGIRMGARDYLVRPIEVRQLKSVIERILLTGRESSETHITSDDVEPVGGRDFFIGVSPIMRRLRAQAALLAEASVPVLILGEDGSGKQTIARLIHGLSIRSGFEFATVNCAALPGELLEVEVFGCEKKGAASAARLKHGKMELCARGTMFIDEITEMPLSMQASLLEVLRNKRFMRPGSSDFVAADVRIVAATSVHAEHAVADRRLLEDLYHELSIYTVHVPSLRDRKEELSVLSCHFMHRLARHYGLSPREFSPAIIEAWQQYDWPGNLHELEHCVKRYLVVGDEELALRTAGPKWGLEFEESMMTGPHGLTKGPAPNQHRAAESNAKSLRSLVQSIKAEAERNAIAAALEKTGWNRKAAARLLKISYRTVLYKIEQYKMIAPGTSALWKSNGLRRKESRFQ
jgi:two-component system response regulator AtoC